jgi:hypothetical protein
VTGDKVSGGYEAGFVHTEQQVAVVTKALRQTRWTKPVNVHIFGQTIRHDDDMGPVRFKVRPGIGFGGAKGYRVVAQTRAEVEVVRRTLEYALLSGFKAGDRVQTLVLLHGRTDRPAGTKATVTNIDVGGLVVTFDGDEGEYSCAPWWFEVA